MLATANVRNDYTGTGSVGPFPFTFKIWAISDLRVVKRLTATGVETVLNYPADFTVPATDVGKSAGGNVTLINALASGFALVIKRVRPLTQTTDLRNQGTYFREDTEDALDKLAMVDQQQQDELNRCFKLTESVNPNLYDLNIPPGGASEILGWSADGLSLISRPAQAFAFSALGLTVANVKDPAFAGGAVGNGIADDTAAIQAALVAIGVSGTVFFPPGLYKITDELLPNTNAYIWLNPNVTIKQFTANKHIFKVVQKDNVVIDCNGAIFYGEGSWSAAWSDFASHNDRGIGLYGCTNCEVIKPRIRNMAMCGLAILGGNNVYVDRPVIEGTHALGHALTAGVSLYQFGTIIMHDPTYGSFQNIHIQSPEIFNVAVGINTVDNTTPGTSIGICVIANANCHDVIGQHGAYVGTANTHLPDYKAIRCGLMAFKIFSGSQNEQIKDSTFIGFVAEDCGAEASQFGVSGTGFVQNCHCTGSARNVTRLHVTDGDVRNCTAVVKGQDVTNRALYVAKSLSANPPVDCSWDIDVLNCAEKAVLISAANSDRNTLRIRARRVSTGGGGHWGVGVNNCLGLTIEKFDVNDDLAGMTFALYVEVNGSGVKMACTPSALGYTTNAFRSDNVTSPVRWEAPGMEVTSEQTAFFGQGNNFLPIAPLRVGRQTTVNANVPLWQMTADDESVYVVTVRGVGKLAGSAERRGFVYHATFWRDAAGVLTQQGATSVAHDVQSAGFAGTISFSPTVNDIRVICNSTAAVTYDWRMDVSVVKMSP